MVNAAVHFLALPGLDTGVALVLFTSHTFALWMGGYYWTRPRARTFVLYLAGLAALFFALVAYRGQPLIYSLAVVFYAAAFTRAKLMLYFIIVLAAPTFGGPYWAELIAIGIVLAWCGVDLARSRPGFTPLLLAALGAVLVVAIALPILHAVLGVTPQTLWHSLTNRQFLTTLWRTVWTASTATAIVLVFGVPLAYILARVEFPGKTVINALVDLPILIPQTVVGLALMNLLGPKTPIGMAAERIFSIRLSGSAWGIVAVQVFVAMPFLVRTAAVAFAAIPTELEKTGRSLGASAGGVLTRISLPLAARGILAGMIMAWARAISESGALMIMAYEPKTASILIYDQFVQYGIEESLPYAALLLIIGFWIFFVLHWIGTLRGQGQTARGSFLLGGGQ